MHVVIISAEIAPAAKVGGLADMVTGLARELQKMGHEVEAVVPMYHGLRWDQIQDIREVYQQLWVPRWDKWEAERVLEGRVSGVRTYFVSCGHYTLRDRIYGYDDDIFRFACFCRAALEFLYKTGKRPHILHCHDWSAALVPVLYYEMYSRLGWSDARVVFTIHNTECQGLCWYGDKVLRMVGLDPGALFRPDKLRDDVHHNCINLMRGGVVYANFVTTVSPTFAAEIKEPASGRGLHHVLRAYTGKLGGIINGVDYDLWNPAVDPKIAQRYDADHLIEKYKNKYALRGWLQLADSWKPIVAAVTRLTPQKGLDLLKHAIYATRQWHGQFVLLGEAPDPRVNADFWRIKNEMRDCRDVHLWLGYHEDLAHLIYAGSDILVVPSLYEPCGLTQLIAMRYGTVPVVRRTGGLADTVVDVDYSGRGLSGGTGFVFNDPNTAGLDSALYRAIRCWFDAPSAFQRIILNGMRADWSWRNPARDYENIYNYIKAK